MIVAVTLATILRVALIFHGQYLYPDESRYDRCLDFWDAVADLEPARAATVLFKAKGRPGAVLTYLPAGLVQWTAMRTLHLASIQTSWIPALFTVLLAACNTIMLWRLGQRLLASEAGAVLAALLYGLVAPSLYYAQFLLPYIATQTYFLGAMLVLPDANHQKRPARRFALSGVLFAMAFATYPGIHDQSLTLMIVAIWLWRPRSFRHLAVMGLCPVAGAMTAGAWEAFSRLGWGPTYLESLSELKNLIRQGDFAEVWRFPADFLWTADPLFTGVLFVGILGALQELVRKPRQGISAAVLCAVLLLWYVLRLLDAAGERQVLYGRLVFQIVPVACLLAGQGLARLLMRLAERTGPLMVAAVLLSVWAGFNLRPFLQSTTPAEFEWRFATSDPNRAVCAFVTSIEGTGIMAAEDDQLDRILERDWPRRPPDAEAVVLANTRALYPVRGFRQPPQLHVLDRAWHPLNIRALQYEAWNPAERTILQAQPIWMMIVKPPFVPPNREWLGQWGGAKVVNHGG